MQTVYRTVEKFKKVATSLDTELHKLRSDDKVAKSAADQVQVLNSLLTPKPRTNFANPSQKVNRLSILNLVQTFFNSHGFYNLTTLDIQNFLRTKLNKSEVPALSTLRRMLRRHFHLKYGSYDKANVKYRDSTYNEKRLWTSRLLAQFLSEDALIISVDESNIRSDRLPSK